MTRRRSSLRIVVISQDAVRKRFFGRIGERVAEKLRGREQE